MKTITGLPSADDRRIIRFAWRLLSPASAVAGGVAFLVPRLTACILPNADPFGAPDPSPVTIQQSPLPAIYAHGVFVASALSPNGQLLATADESHAKGARKAVGLQIWDTRTDNVLRVVAKLPAGPIQLHFTADAAGFLVVTPRTVRCYDVKSNRAIRAIALPRGSTGKAAFSPDGKMLAIPNKAGNVYLVSLETGKLCHTIKPERRYEIGYGKDILNLAFSPDSTTLVVSTSNDPPFFPESFPRPAGLLSLWDVSTGRFRQSYGAGDFVADSVAFSRDQRSLTVVGQMYGAMRDDGFGERTIVDVKSRTGISDVYNHEDDDLRKTYIAPGNRSFVGATLAKLYVWNAATHALKAHAHLPQETVIPPSKANDFEEPPIVVDISDDGTTIAVDDTHRILLFRAQGL